MWRGVDGPLDEAEATAGAVYKVASERVDDHEDYFVEYGGRVRYGGGIGYGGSIGTIPSKPYILPSRQPRHKRLVRKKPGSKHQNRNWNQRIGCE